MPVKGLNHFLFSVSDLDTSIAFYKNVFDAKLLVKGKNTAYFDLNGMWLALNMEKDIPGRKFIIHTRISLFPLRKRSLMKRMKN